MRVINIVSSAKISGVYQVTNLEFSSVSLFDPTVLLGVTPESLIYYESRDYVNGVLENLLLDAEKR